MNSKTITKQFAKNSLQPFLKYFARNNRQLHSFQIETKRKSLFPLSGEINKQSHLFQQSKIAQVNRSFSSSVDNNELPIDKRKWRHEHLKQYLNIFADQNKLNEEQRRKLWLAFVSKPVNYIWSLDLPHLTKVVQDPEIAKKLHSYVGHVSGRGLFTRFMVILIATGAILSYFYYQSTENEEYTSYNPGYKNVEPSTNEQDDDVFDIFGEDKDTKQKS